MKLVITMSRRFGTGASIIAEELSKRLDIPVYDKAYILDRQRRNPVRGFQGQGDGKQFGQRLPEE